LNIIPFQSNDFSIRAVELDGEPWFVGKDIAEALGYTNPSKAMGDHCKGITKRYPLQTSGGTQEMRLINEPDMYRLIVNSKLPSAEKFERWVFEEVLPTIRKTGGYQGKPGASPVVAQNIEAAKVFTANFKVMRLIGLDRNAAAISANQSTQKVIGLNLLALNGQTALVAENQTSRYYTPTELGQQWDGVSAQNINRLLVAAGLQTKVCGHWLPTEAGRKFSRLLDTGRRHSSGTAVTQLKWSADVLPLLQAATETYD